MVEHFGLSPADAGLRTAGFIAVSTLLRPVGGFLADKLSPLRILMFVFAGLTLSGVMLSFSPAIGLYAFGSLTVAVCSGIGNGTVFKLVPFYFSKQAGIANGIVSAMGGLGGFPSADSGKCISGNGSIRDRVYGAFRGCVSQLCPCDLDVLAGKNENTYGEKQS